MNNGIALWFLVGLITVIIVVLVDIFLGKRIDIVTIIKYFSLILFGYLSAGFIFIIYLLEILGFLVVWFDENGYKFVIRKETSKNAYRRNIRSD